MFTLKGVISEQELDRYEATDIHQVLARVPGVYVRGEDGFGLRPNIGLRGANSDRSAKVAGNNRRNRT